MRARRGGCSSAGHPRHLAPSNTEEVVAGRVEDEYGRR
jgi:hypothetical protein